MSIGNYIFLGNPRVHRIPPGAPAAALKGGRRPTGRAAAGAAPKPRKLVCFSQKTFLLLQELLNDLGVLSPPAKTKRSPIRQKNKHRIVRPAYQTPQTIINFSGIRYCSLLSRWNEVLDPEQVWGDLLPREQERLNALLRGESDY